MTPDDLEDLLTDLQTNRRDVTELTVADRLDRDEDRLRGGGLL